MQTTTVGLVLLCMSSHAQTCLDLPGSKFNWSEGSSATLEIIQNQRLIVFYGESVFFYHVLYKLLSY